MKSNSKLILILLLIFSLASLWFAKENPEEIDEYLEIISPGSQGGKFVDQSSGPGGQAFSKEGLNLRVSIYEGGGRPEFRIEAKDGNGKNIAPAEIKLSIELKRLGGFVEAYSFVHTEGIFHSREAVGEPHSFEATVKADWKGKNYSWKYSQIEAQSEIDPEIAKLSGIETSKAGPKSLKATFTLTGEVSLHERHVAHVVPRLNAVVNQVFKHLGDPVEEGEALALLESRDLADIKSQYLAAIKKTEPAILDLQQETELYQNSQRMLEMLTPEVDLKSVEASLKDLVLGNARSQLIPALARLKRARSVQERETMLFEKKISSRSEFDQAREEYQSAEANYNALREKIAYEGKLALMQKQKRAEQYGMEVQAAEQKLFALGLSLHEIESLSQEDQSNFTLYSLRSPLTGKVIQKHLAVGEAVKQDDNIIVVADLSELWVNIAIPVKDLGAVRLGQKAEVTEEYQGLKASGRISFLDSIIDEITRTITGRVTISNPKGVWRPGMYVSVDLVKNESRVPVAVAAEAIQKYRGWDVVFVKYGNLYEARPVTLGRADENWVEILKGLRPNESYVSKNSFAIKAELGKSGAEHSH